MFTIGDTAWAIINMFDIPKKVIIISHIQTNVTKYVVRYKSRLFEIRNEDIYPTEYEAEIFWAILIKQEYEQTLLIDDFFITDEFEIASIKSDKIIYKYAEHAPHILLKYL